MSRGTKWLNCAWVPHRLELVLSPAWRLAPVPLRRLIERLEIEHMRHGGRLNGHLYVAYVQFVAAGVSRRRIGAVLVLGQQLGLIETIRSGEPNGDLRAPNSYRLTYLPIDAHGIDKDGVQRAPEPNPMNGPIFVTGAEPGDALKVEILRMTPIRATGWTRASLAANVVDPEFIRGLPPREKVNWRIDRQGLTATLEPAVPGLEDFVLPLAPMIGCFGVAPAMGQAFSTATSAENGGNMDYRGFGPGATVWFPVAVPARCSSSVTATRRRETARSSVQASKPASRSRCA